MAENRIHLVLTTFLVVALTERTRGNAFDALLEDDDLMFYLSVGLLGFAVLFLFSVILTVVIVTIKIKAMDRHPSLQERQFGVSVIENRYIRPVNERATQDNGNWGEYYSYEKRIDKGRAQVDYLEYMETIILDAENMRIPRAKLDKESQPL